MWKRTTEAIATKRSPSIWGMNRFCVVMRLSCSIQTCRRKHSMKLSCSPTVLRAGEGKQVLESMERDVNADDAELSPCSAAQGVFYRIISIHPSPRRGGGI